jgi:hypothetical protein
MAAFLNSVLYPFFRTIPLLLSLGIAILVLYCFYEGTPVQDERFLFESGDLKTQEFLDDPSLKDHFYQLHQLYPFDRVREFSSDKLKRRKKKVVMLFTTMGNYGQFV